MSFFFNFKLKNTKCNVKKKEASYYDINSTVPIFKFIKRKREKGMVGRERHKERGWREIAAGL